MVKIANKPKIKEIESGNWLAPLAKYEESAKTAAFYGFLPVESPALTPNYSEIANKEKFDQTWGAVEKIAILRDFERAKNSPNGGQSTMFWTKRPFKGSGEKNKPSKIECEITVLHSNKSVAEAILIQTAKSILEQAGHKNLYLRINSLGSRDCVNEYGKKMSAYVRKKMDSFPADLRQALKKDVFYLIKNKNERWAEFSDEAPQSMDYLNEQSRIYFKEVLEFLETIGLPYNVDAGLLGDPKYSTEVVFEITKGLEEGAEVLARGTRWNRLSKILQYKKEIPATSIFIKASANKPEKIVSLKRAQPKFYLVQFGPDAKLKSFLALEELRKAGASVLHSLTKDKLVSQMSTVEQMNIPYLVLMGQKEALENNVIVRDTATRVQHVVPIRELADYIKKIK